MKRLAICIVVAFLLISPICAYAADYSGYTMEELAQMLKEIRTEMQLRIEETLSANKETDFSYAADGTKVVITGYTGSDTELVIPDCINGQPVTRIAADAFVLGSSFTALRLPAHLEDVEHDAFAYCKNIGGDMVLPASLTHTGTQSFKDVGFTGLVIQSDCNMETFSFYGNSKMTFVYIREGASPVLDEQVFYYCRNLQVAVIPASVTQIGAGNFSSCGAVKIVTPAGSAAETWAKANGIPVETHSYHDYVLMYEALFPAAE